MGSGSWPGGRSGTISEQCTDRSLEHKIDCLQVHCINHDKGCRWTGDLRYAQQHLEKATPASTCAVTRAGQWARRIFRWRGKGVACETMATMDSANTNLLPARSVTRNSYYGDLHHHSRLNAKHHVSSSSLAVS